MIGKTLLHYKIIEKLGEGGMGVVYLAEDTKLERRVAIKFLPHYISINSEERQRFKIEAKAAASLNHPNISTIHAIEESEDQIFIVMEYIDGFELKDKIKSSSLPVDETIQIATQIAEGLEAAHKNGIVHRDIKASNIMIAKDGNVKIMDFGLAKIKGGTEVTKIGTTLGTTAYMSPEQTKGDNVDHRTDIWSFGVVLYEMLTGKLPFKGDYEQAVIYSILNENVSLDIQDERLNPKLKQIVERSLEKKKGNRWQTIEEILDEFKSLQDSSLSLEKFEKSKSLFRKKGFLIPAIISLVILVFLVYNFIQNRNRENHARQEVLPRLVKLAEDIPWTGEGPKPWAAYDLSRQIEQVIPDDPLLKSLYKKITSKVSINTVPSEVKVSIKPYSASSKNWEYIGTTPFDSIYLPIGISQIKFEKEGFQTGYDLIWVSSFVDDSITYKLIEIKNVTDGMVYIPNEASWFNIEAAPASLHMPGMEQIKLVPVDNFYMDRTEVSNKEYKEFVDAGGYTTPAYWKYPFMLNGKNLSWQKAMNLFVDKTKRYGPATWEVSDYPDGEDDLPVSGISWYEAAAFAEFKDKSLPTIYHWDRAAFTWASPVIVPQSNLGTNRPISVYDSTSLNRFGIYNLAGNVREWCFNGDSRNDNFILGGGWNDPAYGFNDAYAQSPFDRSETNGFRCIKYIDGSDDKNMLESKIELPYRDYLNEKPVSDERFSLILNQYAYDELPMNSKLEEEIEEGEWIRQKISFNAAYSGERMFGYLFMPKQYKPPYQTVIYFPGSGAIHTRSSKDLGLSARTEFLLKSGRALFIPIYKSTFERGDDLVSDYPTLTNFWKDHIIMWTKDFSRSIDYLETRDDIISDKLVYYGASWGGAMGGIIPAVEKRIKAVVLLVAGLQFQKAFTEAEAINFLPRITQPVLMLNGKYDFFFPYESAQIPFFKLLGTKEENKKIIIYEGGHTVPVTEQVKETLLWLDKYLGTVEKN